MFDKDHLERWCVAWDLICENLEMPLSQELFEVLLEVRSEGPWAPKCCCSRSRFAIPPFDGCIDGIQ